MPKRVCLRILVRFRNDGCAEDGNALDVTKIEKTVSGALKEKTLYVVFVVTTK